MTTHYLHDTRIILILLTQVGLQQIFSNSANFSNMIEAESDFRISKIVQKAFIEVDEHGTETAKVFGMIYCEY